jgi:AraC family transcriptional regulator of adaptative response/methylated-DNA-[protein]-cysteine methyltransferase
MRLYYTHVDSPLGRMLVAATEKGLCFLGLGDTDSFLKSELTHDYPAADLCRDDARLREWAKSILKHLNGQLSTLDLPLDVRGTEFQWQVWNAMRAIPIGETRTYGELAKSLGSPKAARAVGRASALNPVSIVIPCHRMVGSDGSLTGYRWGIERKRALLDRERKKAA